MTTAKEIIHRVLNACFKSGKMLFVAFILQLPLQVAAAWGSDSTTDRSIYGMSMQRDWLYSSKTISIKYEGCVWSFVDDNEDMGCMDDESEDGTSYWYMMANCKRAQVAYSVYASESGSTSCGSGDFKESLITKSGVAEFASTMGYYSANSPVTSDSVDSLPICELDNDGYYQSVGCSSSGTFTIDRFSDAYCLQYYDTYYELDTLNSDMASNNLNKCYSAYSSNDDESPYSSLSHYLISDSTGCSAAESSFCTTSCFVSSAGSSSGFQHSNNYKSNGDMMLANKVKYGLGGSMLLGSVVMFFGILFTNRRKRRALMHRKFRNGPSTRSKSKKANGGSTRSKRKKKRDGTSGRGGSGVLA